MKSLDEHLRDASQSWAQEATPTLVTSADAIAKTLRPRSWMFPWGLGSLGLGVVAAVTFFVSQTPTTQSGTAMSGTAKSGTAMSGTAMSGTAMSGTAMSGTAMSGTAKSETAQPEMSQTSTSQTSTSQIKQSRTQKSLLRVEGETDGFTSEYERVLGQAMSMEASDPLKAVNEYMGLVRMCERREKYAHAVSALERAAILADQIGDVNLKSSVDAKLIEIKGMLAP